MIVITKEYLLQAGYEHDTITYAKGNVWLAPSGDGWHVFLNGLQGGISGTINYIHELVTIEAGLNKTHGDEHYKPEIILPLDRLPELFEKFKDKK